MIVALLLWIASAPMTDADRKAEAARLLAAGNDAFAVEAHEEALAHYQEAYRMYPSPKLYYSLARALDELGRRADAAHYYERFLIESGVEYRSALYERAHQKLRAASAGLGKLRLETTVPGATLFVDGVERTTLPTTPLYLEQGRHELRAEREGFTAFESKVKIEPGKVATVGIDMVAVRVVPAPPKPVVCATEPEPIEMLKVTPPVVETSIVQEWWFWSLIGVAAAAAVGTGVGLAMRGDPRAPERELGDTMLTDWGRP